MTDLVFRRDELFDAHLDLGSIKIDLADYATTGLRIVTIGPSGIGKTNVGLLVAEQLAEQGWVSVIVDPEGESAALYGNVMETPEALAAALEHRQCPIVVVPARDAAEFVPYGEVLLAAADQLRKPIFLVIDEGQMFSACRKRTGDLGEASMLINQFIERGRKRALDLFLTAPRFSGSLHRSIFAGKNLTLIGMQSDPTAWSALAPQFKGSRIGYSDLQALAPGEFFVFSRRGVDKVAMPMAKALAKVSPKARVVVPTLPASFSQWDRAMSQIPTERLRGLTDPVVAVMAAAAGLSAQQVASGRRALLEELEVRA